MIYPGIGVEPDFFHNMFLDMAVVLAEDNTWADEVLPGLDTSNFDLYNFDSVLEFAKDFHYAYGAAPSAKDYGYAETDDVRYLETELAGRTVSPERAEEVKRAVRCWTAYRPLVKIWNTIDGIVRKGVESEVKLDSLACDVKRIAEGIVPVCEEKSKVEDVWIKG